jgi:hypothetical protein
MKIRVKRSVFQLVRKPIMVFTDHGVPSGLRPAFTILSLAIWMSWLTLLAQLLDQGRNILTLSVKIQLGLAVPGVSGRKKYAAIATGMEITPLMTGLRSVTVNGWVTA